MHDDEKNRGCEAVKKRRGSFGEGPKSPLGLSATEVLYPPQRVGGLRDAFFNGLASAIFALLLAMGMMTNAHAVVVDRVVAVVNNEAITEYELNLVMAMRRQQVSSGANVDVTTKMTRAQTLNELINQKLLDQEVDKADVEVTDDELARAVAGVLQKGRGNIEILKADLAAQGITFEEYREQLRKQVKQAKYIQQHISSNVQVSDQDVQKHLSHQKKSAPLDQNITVHLLVLAKRVDPDASSDSVREDVRKLRKITDKARKGADFTKLIADNSDEAEAKQGGDWGTKKISELPSPIASYVRKMKVGGVSDPILVIEAIYIVKLLEKSVQDEAEVKQGDDTVRQKLYNERMEQEVNNYMLKLRRKAYIDIRE